MALHHLVTLTYWVLRGNNFFVGILKCTEVFFGSKKSMHITSVVVNCFWRLFKILVAGNWYQLLLNGPKNQNQSKLPQDERPGEHSSGSRYLDV